MQSIFFVAIGGAIGAVLRYSMSSFIAYRWASNFPLGTLAVNTLGCFLVAFLFVKGIESGALSNNWRLFLIVGIGGAFTTFSSFTLETVQLLREGFYWLALTNIFGNLFLCLLATIAGVGLSKI